MLPRDELIKRAENKEEISRVIDKAEQAIKNWEVVVTDFYSPPVVIEAQSSLKT